MFKSIATSVLREACVCRGLVELSLATELYIVNCILSQIGPLPRSRHESSTCQYSLVDHVSEHDHHGLYVSVAQYGLGFRFSLKLRTYACIISKDPDHQRSLQRTRSQVHE